MATDLDHTGPRWKAEILLGRLFARARSISVWLLSWPSWLRVTCVFVLDLLMCLAATALAYVLRVGEVFFDVRGFLIAAGLIVASWVPLAWHSGLYRGMARYFGAHGFEKIAAICFFQSVALVAIFVIQPIQGIPRTLAILIPLVLMTLTVISRIIISYGILRHVQLADGPAGKVRRTLIVGVGSAARQIALSMRYDPSLELAGFIDPSNALSGRFLENQPVYAMREIEATLRSQAVDSLFLANQYLARAERRNLIHRVQAVHPLVSIRILPSVRELADERVSLNDLKEIEIEDLLGRDEVQPLRHLTEPLRGERILVTGAGGSIGSQLCEQLLMASPSMLILAEMSEFALYEITEKLEDLIRAKGLPTRLVSKLCDVAQVDPCNRLFDEVRPHRVYHAAAYKHVPLLEHNVIVGVSNNIRSTTNVVAASERCGARSLTLVSTDKAVRPTNVMGASKRVCELIVQARAAEQSAVRMSAVRFGNVLGSSGSVVPKFRRQIAAGGPVTVTHRNVVRYFMTIPEAASLVVQAGTMAEGGEIFLLDMGDAVRIADLAHTMIELTGLSVRNDRNPDGDIEIVETGLRQGEKLYEELLIDAETSTATEHHRIVKARETMVPWHALGACLQAFETAFSRNDRDEVVSLLADLVDGFDAHRPDAERRLAS